MASSMPMTAIAGETTAKQIVAAYETGSSVFEANKSYTVKAELRNANEQGNKSMAGDVLLGDAEMSVDPSGKKTVTLHFQATTIMGVPCYATGICLANEDGVTLSGQKDSDGNVIITGGEYTEADFVLDSDNNATATIELPYTAEDGYYQGFINSSFMGAPAALWFDWSSMKLDNGTPEEPAEEPVEESEEMPEIVSTYTADLVMYTMNEDSSPSVASDFAPSLENAVISVGANGKIYAKIYNAVNSTATKSVGNGIATGTDENGDYSIIVFNDENDTFNANLSMVTSTGFEMKNYMSVRIKFAPKDDFSGYVLMNIPYSEFYSAGSASIGDVDAITSATNKVGNYGKAGGGYHNGVTAAQNEDGSWAAVGGENGAKLQGAIWAVKADSLDDVKALGGTEITDDSAVTTATAAHGNISSNPLKGYQTLTEAPSYSYYVLDKAPENYLVLDSKEFKAGTVNAGANTINVAASYGTNWGDVQLNASEASDAADKIINAVVITADDGTAKGLTLLGQVWSSKDIAWKVAVIDGLDGKTIKNIRYYCTVKDTDLTDTEVPAYTNYVYDYSVDLAIPQVYTGDVSAAFDSADQISLSGLPEDVKDLKAKVYYTTGGRNAEYTYLTPVVTDPADDDNDPVFVDVTDGKIAIAPGSTTNKAGVTVNYGEPVDDTKYTVELSSSNYILSKITTTYTAPAAIEDGNYTADIEFLKIDSDDASSAGRSFALTNVPVKAENGKLNVQLLATGRSASMITKIEQEVNGAYTELPFTEVEGGKYVVAVLDNADDIQNIQFTVNTGSDYGVMVNQARVKLVKDTLKKVEVSESSTESTSESSTETSTNAAPAQASAKAEKAADDTIRFVAGIDSLSYKEVGFIFEANGKEVRKSTNTVYSSIADSKIGTADFENAKYLYSFEIGDIADTATEIKVTPYSVDLKGNEVKAESSVYTLSGLSEVSAKNFAPDEVASGSAVEVYAEETEEPTFEENTDVDADKEEADETVLYEDKNQVIKNSPLPDGQGRIFEQEVLD